MARRDNRASIGAPARLDRAVELPRPKSKIAEAEAVAVVRGRGGGHALTGYPAYAARYGGLVEKEGVESRASQCGRPRHHWPLMAADEYEVAQLHRRHFAKQV
jgi:hypothetical protein